MKLNASELIFYAEQLDIGCKKLEERNELLLEFIREGISLKGSIALKDWQEYAKEIL